MIGFFNFTATFCAGKCPAIQLVVWLHVQDQTASTQRVVSLIELYVAFRNDLGGFVSDGFDACSVPTFAADFREFRKMLTYILDTVGRWPRWLCCQRTFDGDRHSCATKQYSYGHYFCSC